MNFKQWLEYVDTMQPFPDVLFNVATELAKKHNLPSPKKFIARGSYANDYDTDKPNVVMRITSTDHVEDHATDSQCDKLMSRQDIQSTGGVVKIYNQFQDSIDTKEYLISYKEKVNINWQDLLKSKHDPDTFKQLINIFKWELPAADPDTAKKALEKIKNYPEMQGLVKAIESGVPNKDLKPENLGVNSNGNIVVIDC